ncbi:1-deoxy-D-xylulose-5-phosphate reductoisomerase [Oscillospiraceae bacterium MB08-C2-2]|nr:1-deoxy-D-xylulose-5-phosphate reductoisomerase [Oscillospiraceae bacterium MB08-C2-2]
MQKLTILGSTGSIGTQTLEVCENLGYQAAALTAHSNTALLEQQARRFLPEAVAVSRPELYLDLKSRLADTSTKVLAGQEAVCELAAQPETTLVNAIVGIAGLRPTLTALEAGKTVALANKETLVAGGGLVSQAIRDFGGRVLPIDSEHSAILQCLQAGERNQLEGVVLTASGGPFYGKTRAELTAVTVEQALRHPTWSMGAKITIDSATLMNKGLEFIEAMWFFDLRPEQIEVLVHRESVIHSAVLFADGSLIAQLGVPDMKLAIQYALTFPRHLPLGGKRLSLADYGRLSFGHADTETFVCLKACIRAAGLGGLAPCVANGANEQAVALFLEGKISFLEIGELVWGAVEEVKTLDGQNLSAVEQADAAAREYVKQKVGQI